MGTQARRGHYNFCRPPHTSAAGLGSEPSILWLCHISDNKFTNDYRASNEQNRHSVPLWHCWGSGVVQILGPPLTVIDHHCNRLSFLLLSIPRDQLQQGHSSLWRYPGVGWDPLKGDRSRREAGRGLCGNMINFFQHHSLSLCGIDEGWKACGQIIWPERLFCWIWDKLFYILRLVFCPYLHCISGVSLLWLCLSQMLRLHVSK